MKFSNTIKIFALCILFNFYNLNTKINDNDFVSNPKVLIFDIGGTLINVNSFSALRYLGSLNILSFAVKTVFNNKSITFKFSNLYLENLSKIPSPYSNPNYNIPGINGKPIPPLQRDAMLGKISLKECRAIFEKWLKENAEIFRNKTERILFEKIFNLNFDPAIFSKTQGYTPLIKLLETAYKKCDIHGKRKNICIVLSNQPKELIPVLEKQYPKIFQYSDAQIFSCYDGYLKPNPILFKKCLELCPELSCKFCLYIDDEQHNLEMAKKIKFNNFSIIGMLPNDAKSILESWGVI